MKLENQVCSLDLSKRLKELGVKQKSLWYYINVYDEGKFELWTEAYWDTVLCGWGHGEAISDCEYYSAFTVAELGEMLPSKLKKKVTLNVYKMTDGVTNLWEIFYRESGGEYVVDSIIDTEANVRAKALIYLLENKLFEL